MFDYHIPIFERGDKTKYVEYRLGRSISDEDFKKMIVELYENKKAVAEIKREYGVAEASLYRWIKEYGKIKTSNNETTTNHEIKRLKKELAQAKEENEILKKAVAIFTQK